jgi:ferrous iron transport protein B
MPNYKLPLFKNVAINVIEKTKAFIYGAGKIILAISIVLWFLASYGPGEKFNNAEKIVLEKNQSKPLEETELQNAIASQKLENSYIGIMGKTIEPVISPLGYDWKIGVAIISSFAAREVFVGTLATIYSVGDSDNDTTIKNKMQAEIHPETGQKIFNAYCFDVFGQYEVIMRFNIKENNRKFKRSTYRSAYEIPTIFLDSVQFQIKN